MKRIFDFMIGLALAMIIIILASSFTYADPPRNKRDKPKKERLSKEQKERKFLNVWMVAGGVVIMWAIQDGVENKAKK